MKKMFFIGWCALAFTIPSFAQELKIEDKRYITVTGSAEVEVEPDAIELEIGLKEEGDHDHKIDLATIEKDFFRILEENNIPLEQVTFTNSDYYWYYWWTYRKNVYKEKRYNVKLDKSTDFMALMKALDRKGISSLRIANTTNEKLQDLRKEVKIQAVQAAKDKAKYLLESIGEKLGRVISIEEMPDNNNNYYWRNAQALSNVNIRSTDTEDGIEHIANITLRYEIKARFEIAE